MADKWAARLAALKAQGVQTVYPAEDRDGWTIHHSVGGAKTTPLAYARQVADMHWNLWQRPGGYNFMQATSGDIYEMCGFDHAGAHAGTMFWNRATLGLCFQGDYRTVTPTDVMADAAAELIWTASAPTEQWTHKEVRPEPTSCPGDALIALLPLEADMPLTQEDKEFITAAVRGDNTDQTDSVWNRYVIRNSAGGFVSLVNALQFIYRKLEDQAVSVDEAAIAQAVVAEMSPALRAAVAADLTKLTMKAV
jgi:hypothetical protein